MLDHSSDEITTAVADILIGALNEGLGSDNIRFFTGVSYRHCLLWKDAPDFNSFMRPHDILGRKINKYLPPDPFLAMQQKSREILSYHPVNIARRERGLRPANSIWLWSPGKKPLLPSFKEKWGLDGTIISAVDLIKGIGICAGMKTVNVKDATGNLNTNYEGKAEAAVNAMKNGADLVYIHIEAPDECGHRAELDNKIKAIEYIDARIFRPVLNYLITCGEPFKFMVLPDHPTPVIIRTHTIDPVPFFIYSSDKNQKGVDRVTEEMCSGTGFYIEHGYNLLDHKINNN
jgi:2,3-bisphosphoglycerate-independent phosphoglycerate mutase